MLNIGRGGFGFYIFSLAEIEWGNNIKGHHFMMDQNQTAFMA